MFSSNQRFLVSGDKDDYLKIALNCAIRICDSDMVAYSIDEKHGLILYKYITEKDKNLTLIPEEDVGNFGYVYGIVKLYLSSQNYKNLLYNTKNEADYLDGSSHQGWLLGQYDELKIDYGWNKAIFVQPYWTFYHK